MRTQEQLEKKEAQLKIQSHISAIREAAFKIKVQVLEAGDTYTTKTAEGEIVTTVENSGMLPSKKNFSDAGFDLYTPQLVSLSPGEVVKVPLNIRMQIPAGAWARIETKSGHGSKGQLVYAGVVDQDYRGIPHVIMANLNSPVIGWKTISIPGHPSFDVPIKNEQKLVWMPGDKIAQMTMNPHNLEFFIERVENVDTNTARGVGGFGSTGAR